MYIENLLFIIGLVFVYIIGWLIGYVKGQRFERLIKSRPHK